MVTTEFKIITCKVLIFQKRKDREETHARNVHKEQRKVSSSSN